MRGAPGRHYDRCTPWEIKTLSHVACPKAFLQSSASLHVRRFGTDPHFIALILNYQANAYDIDSYYTLLKREQHGVSLSNLFIERSIQFRIKNRQKLHLIKNKLSIKLTRSAS